MAGETLTLKDRIRQHADRIDQDLRAADEYYNRTKGVWLLAQDFVREGRSLTFLTFDHESPTGAAGLAAIARHYIASYLAESVFQHYVALLEDFVFGLLELWLSAHPAGIPRKEEKSVDLATILESPDKGAIVRFAVLRELDGLKYKRPVAWFKYLNERVKLGGPAEEVVERLAEIKASRDILAHNRGVINETYLDKAGPWARHEVGDRVEIDEPYLLASWALVRSVVAEVSTSALSKA